MVSLQALYQPGSMGLSGFAPQDATSATVILEPVSLEEYNNNYYS